MEQLIFYTIVVKIQVYSKTKLRISTQNPISLKEAKMITIIYHTINICSTIIPLNYRQFPDIQHQ